MDKIWTEVGFSVQYLSKQPLWTCTQVSTRVDSDRRPGRMPDREILVDSKIMVVAIMVVAIIAVNGRTRSNIRPICQVEFENLVTTMVVVNPDQRSVIFPSSAPGLLLLLMDQLSLSGVKNLC